MDRKQVVQRKKWSRAEAEAEGVKEPSHRVLAMRISALTLQGTEPCRGKLYSFTARPQNHYAVRIPKTRQNINRGGICIINAVTRTSETSDGGCGTGM